MKYMKRILILALVMLTLVSMASVSASDVNDTAIASEDTNQVIEETEIDDTLAIGEDEVIAQTDNDEILSKDDGTFTALQNKINNAASGSTITLENDYAYDNGFDIEGIYISKSLTINGNGHTLDGNHASRIFSVAKNVVFRDIIFINGNAEYGGAIYSPNFSILLENCTFEDNTADCGGAIYINNVGNTVVNCRFSGNSVTHKGGAIHVNDKGECTIENCSFFVNSADYWGGAVYGGSAVNCSFEFNHARYGGGAVCWVSVVNCSFKYNSADESGGAMENGDAVNCSFVDNHAGTNGGAMYYGDAVNCVFLGNSANNNGGAMRSGSAVKCTFILNSARNGGALQDTNAENCTLRSNHADEYGGAIYWGSAESCIFSDNTADVEGDDTYKTEFTKPILTVSNFISPYNSGEKLIINFTNSKGIPITNANMTIRVYKNDVMVGTYYCLSGDGWVVDLNVGDYVAVVGIENQVYDVNPVRATLKIVKANTMIDCESISVICDDNSELVATLTNVYGKIIASANVVVSLDGVNHTLKTNSKGQVKVPVSDLPVGNYTATIYYAGNSEYNSSSTTAKVTVKSSLLVTADAIGTYLNSKISATFLNVDGEALASKQVTFKIGDKTYTGTTNSNGVATADVDLGVGSYTVTAINPVNNEQKQFKLVIDKANSAINLASNQVNGVTTLTVTLTPATATGNVVFNVNGEDKSTPIRNGKATLTLSDLEPGDYSVTASYDGDKNLNASNSTITFTVTAETNTNQINTTTIDNSKIVASNVKVTYAAGSYYTIKVYGTDGKLINTNIKITGGISKTLTATNGIAKFKVTQEPGTYKITISALGKKLTKTITVKHVVTLKSINVKKSAKKLVLQATLAKVNGKVLKNKKVTFKFNGKKYTAKTNAKGVAKYTIKSKVLKKLKVGKKLTYQATYLKDTVKKSVKIKK